MRLLLVSLAMVNTWLGLRLISTHEQNSYQCTGQEYSTLL